MVTLRAAPAPTMLAHNYLRLAGAEAVVKLLTLAAFTWLARTLGPERYGGLEFAVATIAFFALVVDYGLNDYATRQVARAERPAGEVLRDVVRLRCLLAFASFVTCLLLAYLLSRGEVSWLLAAYGLSLLPYPLLLQWLFQGWDRMDLVAALNLTRQVVFTAVIFLWVRPSTALPVVGIAECLGVAAAVVAGLALARKRIRWNSATQPGTLWPAIREGTPLGLSQFLWAFLWFFPTVVLWLVEGNESVGWYGASHRVTMALHTFVWLYFFNLTPSIARCLHKERTHLADLLGSSMRLSIWIGSLIALVVALLSSDLLRVVFGRGYEEGGLLLSLLVWMIPLSVISGHYRYALIACNQQNWLLVSLAVSGAVTLGLSLALIPRYGAIGAAVTLLVAITVNLALAFRYTSSLLVLVGFWRPACGPAAGLLAAAICVRLVPAGHVLWSAGAATLGYLTILLVWEGRRLGRLGILLRGEAGVRPT